MFSWIQNMTLNTDQLIRGVATLEKSAQLILNEEDLLLVKSLLQKWVPNSLVMACGSRVKGLSHGGSDLDLVVMNPKNPDEPTPEITDLKESFSESNLPILVDVIDWAYLPASFKEDVNKIHVVVQYAS
jgi:predicted nucleotidyltransferase